MDTSLQQSGSQPLEIGELKQIIKNRFSFDRRKMIFFTLNSCLLGLALFSLFSAITLESNSQIFRIRTLLTLPDQPSSKRVAARTLETILIPQNLAELCTIICGIIGFFGIYQKSKKILFMYPLSLGGSLTFRVASTIVILSYYNTVLDVKQFFFIVYKQVFPKEGQTFIALEILFLLMDIMFSWMCYLQFKKGQIEYFIVSKDRERLITDNTMAYEVIKRILKN